MSRATIFDVGSHSHSVMWTSLLVLIGWASQPVYTQSKVTGLPKFQDYPVTEVFNGTPHPPLLLTPEQRLFRTRIRDGAEKGWGVWVNGEWTKEQNKPGPNFAGNYIVIVWGRGAGCIRMVVVDAETGTVYNPPLSEGDFALPILMFPNSAGGAAEVRYRKDSQLMIIGATPHADRRDAIPTTFYFLWQRNNWRRLRRVRIE